MQDDGQRRMIRSLIEMALRLVNEPTKVEALLKYMRDMLDDTPPQRAWHFSKRMSYEEMWRAYEQEREEAKRKSWNEVYIQESDEMRHLIERLYTVPASMVVFSPFAPKDEEENEYQAHRQTCWQCSDEKLCPKGVELHRALWQQ